MTARLPTYHRQWCVVLALAGGLAAGVAWYGHLAPVEQPAPLPDPATVRYADWFQIVRCPEMPVEEVAAGEGVSRLAEWLDRLHKAGFHPRSFAEVMRARKERTPLPERTVVLAFLPAYRVTIEQVLPRLRDSRTPGLFISQPPGRIQSDRRFVSDHLRRSHSRTALWDFAVPTGERAFQVEAEGWPEGLEREYSWFESTGITGYNAIHSDGPLNILHANAHWSAEEFVNRLKADLPVRRLSRLSLRPIQDRNWGIVADAEEEAEFNLMARPDSRFASVAWAGTRGVSDLQADLRLESWFGEVWIFLRSATDRAERIRVGLTDRGIRVLQERNGKTLSDEIEPVALDPACGLRLVAQLEEDRLRLQIPDQAWAAEFPVVVPASELGCLELALYHRVHGAAVARAVSLSVEPLDGTGFSRQTGVTSGSRPGGIKSLAVSGQEDSVPIARP